MQREFIKKIYTWFENKLATYSDVAIPPSAIKSDIKEADAHMSRRTQSTANSSRIRDPMDGRSVHTDLPPAKDRILNYKRHTINPNSFFGASASSRPTTATTTARPTTAVSKQSSSKRFVVTRDLIESPKPPSTTSHYPPFTA